MRIVIAGGAAAGLSTALLLAGRGHDIVVLDRDGLEPAPDVESAARSAFRVAAPQVVQPHAVLPRGRLLLIEHFPEVFDRLLAAGAIEATLPDQMPRVLEDRRAQTGDENLTMLMTRRSTFDWVLLRAAAAHPGISLRGGVKVTGLLSKPDNPPHVYGVTTTDGELLGDAVVDATGRRSAADRWLSDIGALPARTWAAECGLAYFSRHYRRRLGAALPGPAATRLVSGFDEFTAGIWAADNDTMLFAIAPLTADRRFRRVTEPGVFHAVLRTIPAFTSWLEVLEPLSPVFAMSGLHNTMRRLVTDGAPHVTGLYAVGDSVCTTNPTLGRGLTLAMQNAVDLADVLDSDADPNSSAVELDRRVEAKVQPFYVDQAANDSARLMALRHAVLGVARQDPPHVQADRVDFAQLRATAAADPDVFRAFFRVLGMLRLPESVYRDAAVVRRVRQLLNEPDALPVMPQPSREELLRALG